MLNIPAYELDKIAFEGLSYNKRPRAARLADVQLIAAQSTWITEGIFLGWTDELLTHADVILWLDCVSWRIAMQRIIIRFMQGGLSEAKRHTGIRKFIRFHDYARNLRQLANVLVSSRRYYATSTPNILEADFTDSRNATSRYLDAYKMKVVHCQTSDDLHVLIRVFEKQATLLNVQPTVEHSGTSRCQQ